ncbi:sugar transferase [Methylobacterium sp. WL69]|uniref:sugar transferase n=1 Tax=Methylobacterium sp. WL69 TaxID=2603893 RepID=UPI0011C7DC08|nr:sugar transferase [Methylobacterium sp. WL69]TXM67318.1 sugar transferase [Methylobacterium sp. WL69]
MMSNPNPQSVVAGAYRPTANDASASGRETQDRLKRGFDVSLATGIIIAFLPLFLIILVALLFQGRPFFIQHPRVGHRGRMFPCLKFRTMVVDADAKLKEHLASNAEARAEWEATRKLKLDPRVTAFGHVLRKSSLDELPQLINVLRGEMSLVGPRPIVSAEVRHYGSSMGYYEQVRPGMTGAWQISGRNDTSYAQRVALDCEYVATRSFRRDLTILVQTFPAVLAARGSY